MEITQKQFRESNEMLQAITRKSWESPAFKEQLISNPIATIQKATGKSISSKFGKIVVEDQTDSNIIYLNIPRKVNIDDLELTDEQLEMVSGGDISTTDLVLVLLIIICL